MSSLHIPIWRGAHVANPPVDGQDRVYGSEESVEARQGGLSNRQVTLSQIRVYIVLLNIDLPSAKEIRLLLCASNEWQDEQ